MTLAMVMPGTVLATPFAKFAGIARLVTHIVAPSYRQASRVANGMYFAHACRSMDEAVEASIFLICDEKRAQLVPPALADWQGKTVLLALSHPEPIAAAFRQLGASVALVTVFDELAPCRFFVEGDHAAVSKARKLFESVKGEVSVAEAGSRPNLEAMRILVGPILMGVLESADLNLRRTGLSLNMVRHVVGRLALETLRVHQRSNARTWRAMDPAELEKILTSLAEADPKLAAHLRKSESATRGLLKQNH